MNSEQKQRIFEFRNLNLGYTTIAQILGLNKSQIIGFCHRHGLQGQKSTERYKNLATLQKFSCCKNCGKLLAQTPKVKAKKFCSEKCRRNWWNNHPELISRKAYYPITCKHCHKEFLSYGNKSRKFCCHQCYIAERFGEKNYE